MFSGKKILVGVCGGIAAYKSCELIRALKRHHAEVRVMMTPEATKFVAPLTFQALSGYPVSIDPFSEAQDGIQHLLLSRQADVIVIAPATANTLAKFAYGMADNIVTSTVLAARCPVILAPAMNTAMWENAATVENMEKLKRRFFSVVEPEYGELASQAEGQGMGRMAHIQRIVSQVLQKIIQPKDLEGVRVLVTAGRTEENIDPVRMLTNRATGRMGFAVAEMAAAMGANVSLISGPTQLKPPEKVEFYPVVTGLQLEQLVEAQYPDQGIVVMAAAVSDFRPEKFSAQKIKKNHQDLTIQLVQNPDILAGLAKRKKDAIHIGFALETENELENAQEKIKQKKLDFIVVNNPNEPGAGFGAITNKVKILYPNGKIEDIPRKDKLLIAKDILERAIKILAGAHAKA